MTKSLPCRMCLMKPVCRHKTFPMLVESCKPLSFLLYQYKDPVGKPGLRQLDFNDKMTELINILKPTNWVYSCNGYNDMCIYDRKGGVYHDTMY
jgi:hypothetical protein